MPRSRRPAWAFATALLWPALSTAEPAFLRSVDELEDPRGYCVDVPGFSASLDPRLEEVLDFIAATRPPKP